MNKVFLPWDEVQEGEVIPHDMAFHWLCFHMKGKFTYENDENMEGSYIWFEEKEDMEYFILMWAESL